MLLPIGRFANSESWLVAPFFRCVIGGPRAADRLVHSGQAVVRESLIVHPASNGKSRRYCPSDGFSYLTQRPPEGLLDNAPGRFKFRLPARAGAEGEKAMTEHEIAQKAFSSNRERLKAERLAREAAGTSVAAKKTKPKKKIK